MLKLYCQKCGALNAYVSEKPNFCQKCGDGFNNNSAAVQNSFAEQEEIVDEEIEEDIKYNLNALDVEIETSKTQSSTLASLMGTGDEAQTKKSKSAGSASEYTADDFMREAGNTRGGNEAEET
jgi:hypothetical protein